MEPLIPSAKRGAFTLVELLVVISIIAVLAALSVGGWQWSQRSARAVACMSNLRQLGGALVRYLGDHEQTFPTMMLARETKDQDVPVIDTVLKAYASSSEIFECPADNKGLAKTSGTSFLWNHKLNGQHLSNLSVTFLRGETITDNHKIMVLGDKEGFHPEPNKVNVLYADGHASKELTFVDDTNTPK